MARIAGVNLPVQKHVWIGLQSIFGIGRTRSKKVCVGAGVNPATKIKRPDRGRSRASMRHEIAQVRGRRRSAPRSRHRDQAPDRPWHAIAACAIVAACRCAASAPAPMRVPARARVKADQEVTRNPETMKPSRLAADKTKKKIKRVVTDAVAHVQASFNNTDGHDHRSPGQRAVVGDRRRRRFPRFAQVDAVRRAGRRRKGRRALRSTTASRPSKCASRARARAANRPCVRSTTPASRSPTSST